eukprot:g8665.t1
MQPPSPSLRILSVNACVLASGLRNEKLPCVTISSGISCFVILFICTVITLFVAVIGDSDTPLLEVNYFNTLMMLPTALICLLVGHIFAFQVARPVGMIISCITGKHDYKKERLQSFVKHFFVDYDVVAVQELYESIPKLLDSNYPDLLINFAKNIGFSYVARPDGVTYPSVANTSGLLILSRYPIIYHEHLVFQDQYFGDRYAVNRAMLYAKIKLPKEMNDSFLLDNKESPYFNFFTCHVCPQMKRLAKGCPNIFIKWCDYTRKSQFLEMQQFIEKKFTNKNELCVIAGDFNADIEFPNANTIDEGINLGKGKAKVGRAMEVVLNTMDKLQLRNCGGFQPTYGYLNADDGTPTETLLTNTNQRHILVGDDLIFSNDKCMPLQTFKKISLEVHGEKFTHLSDHWGISLELRNGFDGEELAKNRKRS